MQRARRVIGGLAAAAPLLVQVEDRDDGHFTVRLLGIAVFDSARREARLARRRRRRGERP
jgi:hypothetical protein